MLDAIHPPSSPPPSARPGSAIRRRPDRSPSGGHRDSLAAHDRRGRVFQPERVENQANAGAGDTNRAKSPKFNHGLLFWSPVRAFERRSFASGPPTLEKALMALVVGIGYRGLL